MDENQQQNQSNKEKQTSEANSELAKQILDYRPPEPKIPIHFNPFLAFGISFLVCEASAVFLMMKLMRSNDLSNVAFAIGIVYFLGSIYLGYKTRTAGWIIGFVLTLVSIPLLFFCMCAGAFRNI